MKIGFASDWHIDVNKQYKEFDIIDKIKEYLIKQKVDILCYAGDVTGDMKKTIKILNDIQNDTNVIIKAVPGNHDIWTSYKGRTSWDNYNKFAEQDFSLIEKPYFINDDWVIIGDMGWYDYSFGPKHFTEKQFDTMCYQGSMWSDLEYCNWGKDKNKDVTNKMNLKLEKQLEEYKNKNIIVVTHVVPFEECIMKKDNDAWNFFGAYIGNKTLGELLKKYSVKISHFGHTHCRYNLEIDNIQVICNPLGYKPEWNNKDSLEDEIQNTIKIITIE